MYLQGRAWAEVILAEPVEQPLRARHSVRREGPAAEWMAPSWLKNELRCLDGQASYQTKWLLDGNDPRERRTCQLLKAKGIRCPIFSES